MTKRDRLVVVAIVVSFFGFSVFGAISTVEAGYNNGQVVWEHRGLGQKKGDVERLGLDDIDTRCFRNHQSSERHTKMVDMLSTVLGMSPEEVEDALSNGDRPREMLAKEGISLYDLEEEFNFEMVGERGFVRFN